MTDAAPATTGEPTFILTAKLDAASFDWLDALRRAHFPPARNVLLAHLTMFHRLSPPQVARLQAMALPHAPLAITFDQVVFLGAGNALRVTSPDLVQLRGAVKDAIGGDISRQDDQRWMPHVTVQNKVTATVARALHTQLAQDFQLRAGTVTGLQLWLYLGGPWQLAQTWPFGAPSEQQPAGRSHS